MEILYYLSAGFLVLFMLLATYDGLYLHIWKFELFKKKESIFEHKTHTIRALLFPFIIWLLFINTSNIGLYTGVLLVVLDLIVLGVDAYVEKDSRKFMNGLPRWEYIIHLFSNSFHFAAIALILATRITVSDIGLAINTEITNNNGYELVQLIAVNIIPGAILLALLHVIVLTVPGLKLWNRLKCC